MKNTHILTFKDNTSVLRVDSHDFIWHVYFSKSEPYIITSDKFINEKMQYGKLELLVNTVKHQWKNHANETILVT